MSLLVIPQIACHAGCAARYCCHECAIAAWGTYHCMLCPGPQSSSGAGASGAPGSSGNSAGASSSDAGSSGAGSSSQPSSSNASDSGAWLDPVDLGVAVNRAALRLFGEHADNTNDIFHVAARVIATVLLRHLALQRQGASDASATLQPGSECGPPATAPVTGVPAAAAAAAAAFATADCSAAGSSASDGGAASAALLQAWLPFHLGWKAAWWQCVALPEDVDDEAGFREEIRHG